MYRAAAVFCSAAKRPIACEIVDLSDSGARLTIVARMLIDLPPTFTLALFNDGGVYRDCKVVWTDRWNLGVTFTSAWYTAPDLARPSGLVRQAPRKASCRVKHARRLVPVRPAT